MLPLKQSDEFFACISDLIGTPEVLSMDSVPQHVEDISCLFHSIFVAYLSFRMCRFFHLDFTAAARGGLLHDLFLYDWRVKGSHSGLHGFTHPQAALRNASQLCELSDMEKDIIAKHMRPLTLRSYPRYRESLVVSTADKICAVAEFFHLYHAMHMESRLSRAVHLFRPGSELREG